VSIKINWGGSPPNTIQCARFLRAYKDMASSEELEKVTRHLFVSWSQSLLRAMNSQIPQIEMFDRETSSSSPAFLQSLTPALIPEEKLAAIIARSQSQEIKDCLKIESAALVNDYGAFGFPWIIVRRSDGATASFFGKPLCTNSDDTPQPKRLTGSDRFANMAWW
jgi:glutathione S-transferase kappa 1